MESAAVPFPRNTPNEGIESSVVGRRMTRRIARSPRCARSLPRTTDWKASSLRNPSESDRPSKCRKFCGANGLEDNRRRAPTSRPGGEWGATSVGTTSGSFRASISRLEFAPRFAALFRGSLSRLVSRLKFAARFAARFQGAPTAAVSQSRKPHLSPFAAAGVGSFKGRGLGGGWGRPRSARRASRRRPARPCRRSPAPRLSLPARSGMRRGHARRKPSELHYKTLLGEFEFKLS